MHMCQRTISFAAFFLILLPSSGLSNAPLFEPPRLAVAELKQIIPDLHQGGYVIYIRHMSTDHSQEDQRPVDLAKCHTQRKLSTKGRQQARALGKAFRQLNIPIGRVISSPFCRCMESARLAFGKFETSDNLYFAMGLTRQDKQAKGRALRDMMRTQPVRGKNMLIISHTANLQEAVGLWPTPEGVAYLFKPGAQSKPNVIGKVNPETWSEVLKQR